MKTRRSTLLISAAALALLGAGCIRTTHEIKPIHITMDINLKVDRALDDFFGDVDRAPAVAPAPANPAPAAATNDPPAKEGN